jgi:hypothetical protein
MKNHLETAAIVAFLENGINSFLFLNDTPHPKKVSIYKNLQNDVQQCRVR